MGIAGTFLAPNTEATALRSLRYEVEEETTIDSTYQNTGGNGSALGDSCGCAVQVPENYVPSRLDPLDAIAGKCHPLIDRFNALWTMYECRQAAACEALAMAEAYIPGMVVNQAKKDLATMNIAAHLLDLGVIAGTEMQARVAAISRGESVSRDLSSIKDGSQEWYGLTVWGLAAWGLIQTNARAGFLVV